MQQRRRSIQLRLPQGSLCRDRFHLIERFYGKLPHLRHLSPLFQSQLYLQNDHSPPRNSLEMEIRCISFTFAPFDLLRKMNMSQRQIVPAAAEGADIGVVEPPCYCVMALNICYQSQSMCGQYHRKPFCIELCHLFQQG